MLNAMYINTVPTIFICKNTSSAADKYLSLIECDSSLRSLPPMYAFIQNLTLYSTYHKYSKKNKKSKVYNLQHFYTLKKSIYWPTLKFSKISNFGKGGILQYLWYFIVLATCTRMYSGAHAWQINNRLISPITSLNVRLQTKFDDISTFYIVLARVHA